MKFLKVKLKQNVKEKKQKEKVSSPRKELYMQGVYIPSPFLSWFLEVSMGGEPQPFLLELPTSSDRAEMNGAWASQPPPFFPDSL